MKLAEQNRQLTHFQLILMRCIANGHEKEGDICRILHTTPTIMKAQIQELKRLNCIVKHGFLLKRWKLTDEGINRMIGQGFVPEIPPAESKAAFEKQEIRHTSTLGTGFKLTFGGLIGIFAAWIVIGGIASLIYWAGYNFVIKQHIPSEILPYLPFGNLLIDVVLGFMTAAAFFLPLRRKFGFQKH